MLRGTTKQRLVIYDDTNSTLSGGETGSEGTHKALRGIYDRTETNLV